MERVIDFHSIITKVVKDYLSDDCYVTICINKSGETNKFSRDEFIKDIGTKIIEVAEKLYGQEIGK